MGRKAKDAAQKKIGELTSNRRNVSKKFTPTTKSQHTNTPNENNPSLDSQTRMDVNNMKNCSVRLEKLDMNSELMKAFTSTTKDTAADVVTTDKRPNNEKIYDYSFDGDDTPLEDGNENAMKDLFEKLAKENKIEVARYRPRNKRVKKTDGKDPIQKKKVTQKRRREKQINDAEPPGKKSNLKNQVTDVIKSKTGTSLKLDTDVENMKNNNHLTANTAMQSKKTTVESTVIPMNSNKVTGTINIEHENARAKRQNRNVQTFQSTPKSSTPLGMTAKKNMNNYRSLFFDNESPLSKVNKNDRENAKKYPLQLSAIKNQEVEQPGNIDEDFYFDVDVDMISVMDPVNDKENSKKKSETTSTCNTNPQASIPSVRNIATVSTFGSSNSTNILDKSNETNIFSPTKRRVYARSPLKNITSEVNNSNSPNLDLFKSVTTTSRNFGVLHKSTHNLVQSVNSSKETEITLPEGSYLSSRRAADDFDRAVNSASFADDCFGFNVDEDESTGGNNLRSKIRTNNVKDQKKNALKNLRNNLKRFLHNTTSTNLQRPVTENDSDMKTQNKVNSSNETGNSQVKQKNVFTEVVGKQRDIRHAFKTSGKSKATADNPVTTLFAEIETVQDRRKSYSRPHRQRKRRNSTDSDEEQNSELDSDEEDGKKCKRTKRRKKLTAHNPKETEDLEQYARTTNDHFAEVDSFVMIVE